MERAIFVIEKRKAVSRIIDQKPRAFRHFSHTLFVFVCKSVFIHTHARRRRIKVLQNAELI